MAREYKQVDAQKELLEAFKIIQGDGEYIRSTGFKHNLMQATENGDPLS